MRSYSLSSALTGRFGTPVGDAVLGMVNTVGRGDWKPRPIGARSTAGEARGGDPLRCASRGGDPIPCKSAPAADGTDGGDLDLPGDLDLARDSIFRLGHRCSSCTSGGATGLPPWSNARAKAPVGLFEPGSGGMGLALPLEGGGMSLALTLEVVVRFCRLPLRMNRPNSCVEITLLPSTSSVTHSALIRTSGISALLSLSRLRVIATSSSNEI